MIDLTKEKLIRLSQAARLYPGGGRHICQIHRYRMNPNTPLECLKVGGVWMTTVEAMHRHVYDQTEAARRASSRASMPKPKTDRKSSITKAKQELAAAGI